MAPLKIAIASLLVGLIGLTASAMENPGSSSASPHATELQPLTRGLTLENVRDVLRRPGSAYNLGAYKRRLRELASSEAGYRYEDPDGSTRIRALSDPEDLRIKIYRTENYVLQRMREQRSEQGGAQAEQPRVSPEIKDQINASFVEDTPIHLSASSSASPHATERQPLTTGLTLENVRENLNPGQMREYRKLLTQLALSEAGYRYTRPDGTPRKYVLLQPDLLRKSIFYKEKEILKLMQIRLSAPGEAQAEQPRVSPEMVDQINAQFEEDTPIHPSASPHATEPQPLTTGLTLENVRENLNPGQMREYSTSSRELALSEAGYRYEDPSGRKRTRELSDPLILRLGIPGTENYVLQRMQEPRSEQGGAQAERGGAQAEQGGAQAEQGGA